MPIDPAKAIGAELPERSFAWTESDVLLYHLGVGAGSRQGDQTDPKALRYTLDGARVIVRPSGTEPKIKFYMFTYTPPEQLANLEAAKRQLAERLDRMERDRFDLVLLDILMPEIDGVEVLRILGAVWRSRSRARSSSPPYVR